MDDEIALRSVLRRGGFDAAARELRECAAGSCLAAWDEFRRTGRFVAANGLVFRAVTQLKRRPAVVAARVAA